MATRAYSTLLACLYDEPAPVGSLGRGTHYSVLRSVTWLDQTMVFADAPKIHDFAVIWDEDHDERVIPVIEGILMAGMLSPVICVGERKGALTVVVDRCLVDADGFNFESYKEALESLCSRLTKVDHWPVDVAVLDREGDGTEDENLRDLINDNPKLTRNYLMGIDAIWKLGVKSF
jgi:hypothetical protein